jgi:hypothetical protein
MYVLVEFNIDKRLTTKIVIQYIFSIYDRKGKDEMNLPVTSWNGRVEIS